MSDSYNPLFLAIQLDDLESAKKAIVDGVDVNAPDVRKLIGEGNTPLHEASNNGQLEMVKLLLEFGAEANAQCNAGWTPLLRACNAGNTEIAKILIDAGADVTIKNNEGYTALSRVPGNNAELIKLLV